jgi:hypothetical protein
MLNPEEVVNPTTLLFDEHGMGSNDCGAIRHYLSAETG